MRVIAEELEVSGRTGLVAKMIGGGPKKTIQHADADIGASIASGSHPSQGMVILPCSMGTRRHREWPRKLADLAGS